MPRLRCRPCRVTHALLRAFVLAERLDTAGTVGGVIKGVADGRGGTLGGRPRRCPAHDRARAAAPVRGPRRRPGVASGRVFDAVTQVIAETVVRGRPGRSSSARPSSRPTMNRDRHLLTVT